MAHRTRTQPDSVLVTGYAPTGADLADIDDKSQDAISGDNGGAWTLGDAPVGSGGAQMIIGGAGMECAGAWNIDSGYLYSPLIFNKGTADDYFGTGRGLFGAMAQKYAGPGSTQLLQEVYAFYHDQAVARIAGGPGAAATSSYGGIQTLAQGARFFVPLRVFSGATIGIVYLKFRVMETHANPPTSFPQMRIVRQSPQGTLESLAAISQTVDANGFMFLSSTSSGSTWTNGFAAQDFYYTCNQNNVIDVGSYTYFIEIIDESGTNAWATTGNIYHSVTAQFVNYAGLIDGRN